MDLMEGRQLRSFCRLGTDNKRRPPFRANTHGKYLDTRVCIVSTEDVGSISSLLRRSAGKKAEESISFLEGKQGVAIVWLGGPP